MIDFFQNIADFGDSIINYITATPTYFEQFIVYLNSWWVAIQLRLKLMFVRAAYVTAITLLNEIGFNVILEQLFNALPSELRFYAFSFKVPEAISIYMNCGVTAICMRMMK